MKNIWKIILLTIGVGLILSIIGLATGGNRTLYWDRTGLHTTGSGISSVTEHNLGSISNIHIDAGFSDIEFVRSDSFGIELFGDNMEWVWTLEGDTLTITHYQSTRFMILNIDFFSNQRNYAKIYLPENAKLDTVNLKTGSGNIEIGNFQVSNIEIENSFGNIDLENITSDNLKVSSNSGRFTGTNINTRILNYNNSFGDGRFNSVHAQSLNAECNSGNITFTNCKFGEAIVTNKFGDITADNITSLRSSIRATSGTIRLNGDFVGETIVHTDFGDIRLTTEKERSEYSYEFSVRFGSIRIDNERQSNQTTIINTNASPNHIKLTSSSGDIRINFAD